MPVSEYEKFISAIEETLENSASTFDAVAFSKAVGGLLREEKESDTVRLLNDHPEGMQPYLKLTEDGTGSFMTQPFPQDHPVTQDDILKMYNLDTDDWSVVSMEVLTRWAWFRFSQGEDAITAPCHQYRGKVESRKAHPRWEAPSVVNTLKLTLGGGRSLRAKKDYTTIGVFGDQQIGFGFHPDGSFYTTHHTEAISTAIQIARDAEIDIAGNVGDVVDFAQWSDKYASPPEQSFSTQAALEATHAMLAMQKEIADRVIVTQGNHENRMMTTIMKLAKEAYRLTPAGANQTNPVLSMEHLLQTDALGVEWFGPYGAYVWFRDDLAMTHGQRLSARDQARGPIHVSTITGHIHRAEMQSRTHLGRGGEAINTIHFTPGTLCRTLGAVPSTKGAYGTHGQPLHTVEDWQLGFGLVSYTDDVDMLPTFEFIPITNEGKAFWRGKVYSPDSQIVAAMDERSISVANEKMSPRS